MKGILANTNFKKLWFGQFVSILGDQIHFIALMVLVQSTFENIVVTGTLMMINSLPKILFSPFAGVFVDRWPFKRTMVISDLLRMVLVLLIPFLFVVMKLSSMSTILILTFLISTVSVFFYPAKSASIPTLVEEADLLQANSLSGTTQVAVSLLGLVGGAVFVSLVGFTTAFVFDAFTFLISAISISLIQYPPKKLEESRKNNSRISSYFEELKSGISYMVHHQLIRFLVSYFATLLLIAGAVNLLLFQYIQDILHKDTTVIGYLYGANMVGMIVTITLIPKITKYYPKEKLLIWSSFIFAFTIGSFYIVEQFYVVLLIMVVNGVANGLFTVTANTILQEKVEEIMRGRVFSVVDSIAGTASVISMLPAAWLAKQFGVLNIFLFTGIAVFILFIFSYRMIDKVTLSSALQQMNPKEELKISKEV